LEQVGTQKRKVMREFRKIGSAKKGENLRKPKILIF
jgi:hypothetical protein